MSVRTAVNLLRSRRNLFLNSPDLERLQIRKMRKILAFAHDNVTFYHYKLQRAGVKPDDVRTLRDLARIPLTTKSEIQNAPLNSMIARNVEVDKYVKNRTSGSTGLSLTTLTGKKTDQFDGTMWLRAYFLNGMRFRDKMVIIRDLSTNPEFLTRKNWLEHFGIMQRRYASVFDDTKVQAKFFADEKPDIIESYPSSLVIMGDLYEDEIVVKPRLVFTMAEFLDDRSRTVITRFFQSELFDYYGSAEIGLMSWECKQHSGYHINSDNIIMEFISESGEPSAPGEKGEIVCTNLFNYEMPMIRYKHEDVGTAVSGHCTCGVKLPLMRILGGRKDDFLMSTDGRIMPPTIFFPYPFLNFEKIKQFRVIQEKRTKLRIQLVVKETLAPEIFEKAEKEIKRVFGQNMETEFEILDQLARTPGGKVRKIISKL